MLAVETWVPEGLLRDYMFVGVSIYIHIYVCMFISLYIYMLICICACIYLLDIPSHVPPSRAS